MAAKTRTDPSETDDLNRLLRTVMSVEPAPVIQARNLPDGIAEFTRYTSKKGDRRMVATPTADAYLAFFCLADSPARHLWFDGKYALKPAVPAGVFAMIDRRVQLTIDMEMQFDNVHMQFPRAAFENLARESGYRGLGEMKLRYIDTPADPIIGNLARCLLPAFKHPKDANQLFLDHVACALVAHLTTTYFSATAPQHAGGGLAPWQARRATEILLSRLDGNVTLENLAGECGLSRSHFARAFKSSTGLPPHRWLLERRLERAQDLLLRSNLTLAEIAVACGFADHSHFSRSFAAATGVVPSAWRRRRRS